MQPIDPKLIRQQGSLLAAVRLCISMAGFDSDKEVFMPLGINAGHWSRMCSGDAHWPLDKLCALMDLCGNEAPLLWLIEARGYEPGLLRQRETEVETRLRVAEDEVRKLRAESAANARFMAEMMVASKRAVEA